MLTATPAPVATRRLAPGLAQGLVIALVAAASVAWNTRFDAPPRYDGAGYAVLAESLRTGRGYREIDHPAAPQHAHFPPGYPVALAALWSLTGRSAPAAHALSLGCTVLATLLGWRLFARTASWRVALPLGLALAVNGAWGRVGGSIQSEPLYLVLELTAVLVALWAARTGGPGPGSVLGVLLGACILTRHVGVALAVAILVDLLRRGRYRVASSAAVAAAVTVSPWVGWLVSVGGNTQAGLLPRTGLLRLVGSQALFYLRRLPDQIVGPVIEVATVFRPQWAVPATIAAALATALMLAGWCRCVRSPRRRLLGLVPLVSLALLLVWPFTEAGRFLIPLVPLLLVGCVEGLAPLLARIVGRRRARLVAAWLVLLVSVPYPLLAISTRRVDAQEATHAAFDAACAVLATEPGGPGPVLGRQAGEIFWQSGQTALAPPADADPAAIETLIQAHGVTALLVDDDRYKNSAVSPLGRYVQEHPERVERVWSASDEAAMAIYRVRPEAGNPG